MIENLKIFGKRYTVKLVPDSQLDQQLRGAIVHSKGQIEILGGMTDEQARETILHEAVHAIDHELQLGLSEQQVGAVSVGLFHLADSNPEQMRWMLGLGAQP